MDGELVIPASEDHDRHLQAAHVQTLMGQFEDVVAGPPEIVAMRPLR